MRVDIPTGMTIKSLLHALEIKISRHLFMMNRHARLNGRDPVGSSEAFNHYAHTIGITPEQLKAVQEQEQEPCDKILKSLGLREWQPMTKIYVADV